MHSETVYKVIFYINSRGEAPVKKFIDAFNERDDKNSRINYAQISAHILTLQRKGVAAGLPHIEHLDGEIYELRPINNRILFAPWDETRFILLHHFPKKTQKTPRKEIDTAKRRLAEARKEPEAYE